MKARLIYAFTGFGLALILPGCFLGPHPLEGQTAPGIVDAQLLDGGAFSLSDHIGEHVVILDFWATWCGPCVQAMPELEKIGAEYRDRGVRLYAVNVGESPNKIQSFLNQHEIETAVILDPNGRIASDYVVDGIPQTVIIDKTGTIQTIYVGYSSNTGNHLRHVLNQVVQGKNVAR